MTFMVEIAFNKIELLKAIKTLRKIRSEIVFQLPTLSATFYRMINILNPLRPQAAEHELLQF